MLAAAVLAAVQGHAHTRAIQANGSSIIVGMIPDAQKTINVSYAAWVATYNGGGNWSYTSSPATANAYQPLTAGASGSYIAAYTSDNSYSLYDASVRGYVSGEGMGGDVVNAAFETDDGGSVVNVWGPSMGQLGVNGIYNFRWQVSDSYGGYAEGTQESFGITPYNTSEFRGTINVRVYGDYDYGYWDTGETLIQVQS